MELNKNMETKIISYLESEYPCVKECASSGLIVLFTRKETGTVLKEDAFHKIGETRQDWIESNFKKVNVTIEFKN